MVDLSKRATIEAGLNIISVEKTPANVGSTNYLMGFNYTDQGGYLQTLSTDVDTMKVLYSLEKGQTSSLIKSSDSFIVASVSDEGSMDSETKDYISMIYPYVNQQTIQQDLVNQIFTSAGYEDNFLTVYLDKIMGVTSAQ